ncbi:MAG: UPF0182 family protein [Polyangiaceae bacterium]
MSRRGRAPRVARPLFLSLGFLALTLGAGRFLAIYHLMYSKMGVVYGPGCTDVFVRMPANQIMGALLAVAGAGLVAISASSSASRRFGSSGPRLRRAVLLPGAVLAGAWVIALFALPLVFQWLRVGPNEITVEAPYLAHNIAFTRKGFALDKVEQRDFAPSDTLTPEAVGENEPVLAEVRLWDPAALQSVYKQFQEIRLYYKMADVDIDRYNFGDRYRQVMVSAREMDQRNLPAQSQTFVNQRFKYTHGFGITMASAHDFTADGLPNLLVKDIPPVSAYPELAVTRPEIYYGQLTSGYVVANTEEPELDYPSGADNVYTKYQGKGGVQLTNAWRKLVYGWKLGGTRLLFSGYPTSESRILFHRAIHERVSTLAPFLDFDHDPYIVLVNGRLKWIVDAYTTSSYFPYSEPYFSGERVEPVDSAESGRPALFRMNVASYLHGANYVRNSVKAVVDAYDGDVTFYVFAPDDPILRVYERAFPGMFRPRSEMPAEVLAHVRYPEGYLLAQGLVYAKYHMTDPAVFYNQEDLWVRATERYHDEVRTVAPYYVMWRPAEQTEVELALILPFTPKNRQVLIGWIAGLCDPANYGRLLTYRFPKDEWVLGTQQVDTKIDQDRFLSSQLSLWDQRGSRVLRGNVLVIPIGEMLLYVEPIYLQAEQAAYPELRIVVVMDGKRMSYGDTFDEALARLASGAPAEEAGAGLEAFSGGQGAPPTPATSEAARRASEGLDRYFRLMGQRRLEEAAAEMRKVEEALKELTPDKAPPPPRGEK